MHACTHDYPGPSNTKQENISQQEEHTGQTSFTLNTVVKVGRPVTTTKKAAVSRQSASIIYQLFIMRHWHPTFDHWAFSVGLKLTKIVFVIRNVPLSRSSTIKTLLYSSSADSALKALWLSSTIRHHRVACPMVGI